jgi:hypothetical protein
LGTNIPSFFTMKDMGVVRYRFAAGFGDTIIIERLS